MKNKFQVSLLLCTLVFLGVAATQPPQGEPKRNLKVLPKDISHDDLDKIMHGFNDALGVKCNFCHAALPAEAGARPKLDFASDEKPEKNFAREMLKMSMKLNKKYFDDKKDDSGTPLVTCMTCHNGKAHPANKK